MSNKVERRIRRVIRDPFLFSSKVWINTGHHGEGLCHQGQPGGQKPLNRGTVKKQRGNDCEKSLEPAEPKEEVGVLRSRRRPPRRPLKRLLLLVGAPALLLLLQPGLSAPGGQNYPGSWLTGRRGVCSPSPSSRRKQRLCCVQMRDRS